jgi:hypothetical protein
MMGDDNDSSPISPLSNLKVLEAALLRKDLAAITNVVIEELVHRRYELQSAPRNLTLS